MSAILFVELANNFVTFSENVIISIRSRLHLFCTYDTSDSMLNCQLDIFLPTSIAELLKVVRTVESKSCIWDPQTAVFFFFGKKTKKQKTKTKTLEHASTNTMYDCEVVSGTWPPSCPSENCLPINITQETFPGLEHQVLGNYRPISNLNVISRCREGVAYNSWSHPWPLQASIAT